MEVVAGIDVLDVSVSEGPVLRFDNTAKSITRLLKHLKEQCTTMTVCEAALPTVPTPTPDVSATVQASVAATIAAWPTPTPAPRTVPGVGHRCHLVAHCPNWAPKH